MGYTTSFDGQFSVTPALSPEHRAYLKAFSGTRRMKRCPVVVESMNDPIRQAVGLPVGKEGGYYVGGNEDRTMLINYNEPPHDQPGLWCQWVPTDDGTAIGWSGAEKFYEYVSWIQYLIDHFLSKWGYQLNGKVEWQGEDPEDRGIIGIKDNVVKTGIYQTIAPNLD